MTKYRIKTVNLQNGTSFHYPQEKDFIFWHYFIKNQDIGGDPEYFKFSLISDAQLFLSNVKKDLDLKNVSESVKSVVYTPYN